MKEIENLLRETSFNLYDICLIDDSGAREFHNQRANRCNNSYSVAKAFTMTAVGMLVSEGKLSLDAPIPSVLANEIRWDYNRAWDKVTCRDALLHRTGISEGFLDIDADDISRYPHKDYLRLSLARELPFAPGSREVYSDMAYYLLSRVVEAVSGERLDDFLMKRLFEPMDFTEIAWSKCPLGHAMGATGLYISSRDMAKLPLAYMNGGEYKNKRVIPEDWTRAAIENGFELRKTGPQSFGKGGMLGQMIAFCPATRRAVAWHALDGSEAEGAFRRGVIERILEV